MGRPLVVGEREPGFDRLWRELDRFLEGRSRFGFAAADESDRAERRPRRRVCGGQLDVFVEPILPQPRAIIFGAGHISKSLSKIANMAGWATTIVDDREMFANRERFPGANEVVNMDMVKALETVPIGWNSFVILATRGHKLEVGPDWSEGRLTAASRDGKRRKAAANPRGMQGYAAGR